MARKQQEEMAYFHRNSILNQMGCIHGIPWVVISILGPGWETPIPRVERFKTSSPGDACKVERLLLGLESEALMEATRNRLRGSVEVEI